MTSIAYKFRIYPTRQQQEAIARNFSAARFAYNYSLAARKAAYEESKASLSKFDQMTEISRVAKEEQHWLLDADSRACRHGVSNLDAAYQQFFRRVKKGEKKVGFPRFKSRYNTHQSYTTDGSIRVTGESHVKLPKLGNVKCKVCRPIEGRIVSATVSRDPDGRYYVSLCCQKDDFAPLPQTDAVIGLDMGVDFFMRTSDGEEYPDWGFTTALKEKLERMQQAISRKDEAMTRQKQSLTNLIKKAKQVGDQDLIADLEAQREALEQAPRSNRRAKVAKAQAKLHKHIANQRADALQKLSTNLIRQYDVICIEDIPLKTLMMTEETEFASHASDSAWGDFTRMLQYKADWYGKQIVKVPYTPPTTQTCSYCKKSWDENSEEGVPAWICPDCGKPFERSKDRAQKILEAGLKKLGQNEC